MGSADRIPLEACVWCLEGQTPHQPWHPTRAELLKIGREMTARVRERERWCVRQMLDDELLGYGARMRRLLVTASADHWPEWLVDLVREWLADAEREWRWRERAARLGADRLSRQQTTWADRVERVKREADLLLLIGFDAGGIEPAGPGRYRCCCPFHDDRHPSLDIDATKGVWICRVCAIGGDAITYAELRNSITFPAAVRHLEARLGIDPPRPVRRIVEMA